MIGMSLVISKPCCPKYNFGTTSKMIDLIRPCRLSNLHLQGISPSVAITTRMPKHRAHLLSAIKDGKSAQRSQVVEVCGVVAPSVLLGVAIIGIAFSGILKSDYHIFPLCAATSAAGTFLDNILKGYAETPCSKLFSIGEIIQVIRVWWVEDESVKGQVTNIGLIATSLLGAGNVPVVIPNSALRTQGSLINISRSRGYHMESKIFVQVDHEYKKISSEIIKMMKSNSNVYLKEQQPYCYLSGLEGRYGFELTFGCRLKMMCEDEFLLVRQDILMQSAQIIKKHGATLAQHMEEVKGL